MSERALLTSRPGILIFGDEQSGNCKLLTRLVGGPECAVLRLDTKYYTAEAQVETGADLELSPRESLEAIILMFDTCRETSFRHVQEWLKVHDLEGIEIRICIANHTNANKYGQAEQQGIWLQEAVDWCRHAMIEYIEVALDSPEIDSELIVDGEPHGMTRVKDVLEAHLWPGLVMKDVNSAPFQPQLSSQKSPISSTDDTSNGTEMRGDESDEDTLQGEMESLEALMNDVAVARHNIGSLPDKERRKEAELMTMQLISKLGLEDDVSLDSDSESQ